jgi:deazaflavin-dependent oxidoreductase (nitroreductase family)
MIEWKKFNPEVIAEFRSNAGKVAQFGDLPVAILHTIGARSSKVREIPLIVIRDGEDMLIFGSAAGARAHPDWYYNLRAHPRIEVELGTERFTADVIELTGQDARKRVEFQASTTPQFADYVKSAAPRAIPVFSITRV